MSCTVQGAKEPIIQSLPIRLQTTGKGKNSVVRAAEAQRGDGGIKKDFLKEITLREIN